MCPQGSPQTASPDCRCFGSNRPKPGAPPPLQPTYATYLPTVHAFEFCAKVACSFSNSKPRHIGTSSKYSRKRNFAQVAFCMACSRLTWALLWHRARAQSPLLLRPSALDPGARLKSHIDIFERRKRSCAVLGDGASWNSTGGAVRPLSLTITLSALTISAAARALLGSLMYYL